MRTAVFLMIAFAATFAYADQAKFTELEIVPDVIDEAPGSKLSITYEGGEKVQFGNVLTPTQVQKRPTYTWDHEEGAFYSLLFVDPDAPSRANPTSRAFLHGMIVNIPGNNVDAGQELFGFLGSGPPKGSGLHRYVTLVYKQPGRMEFSESPVPNTSIAGRRHFDTRKWTADHGLGKPVAGNFYQAEWDDYVPKLYAQFKDQN